MWNIFRKLIGKRPNNISEESRKKGLENLELQHKIRALERKAELNSRLAALEEGILKGGNGGSEQDMFMQLAMPMLMKALGGNAPQQQTTTTPIEQGQPQHTQSLSTEQIEQAANLIKSKVPNIENYLKQVNNTDIILIKDRLINGN